ncbi:MAG: ATP-binding protein [Rhodothermales bacterium]
MHFSFRIRPPAIGRLDGAPLDAREAPEWLRTYRVYCLLTGIFLPFFGLAYDVSAVGNYDPLWLRLLLSGLCLAVLGTSYVSNWVARHLNHIVYTVFILITLWMVGLNVQNQFAADYSVGLIFCVAATSLSLSFIPSARLPLLWYQILMTAVVTGAALLTSDVETGRVVLVACLAGIAFVTDVAATIRSRLEEDRDRYKNHLIAANERAEEMLRLKASFINNMNHEIRTPLTGIIGFAEIIGETAGDEQQEYARVIQEAGRRLMDTLTGILDLAHLESGGFNVAINHVDLNAAAREVVTLLENRAYNRNLTLRVECPPIPVTARADHAAVTRIVYNLVSNGIKFTEHGGVTIRTLVSGDSARVEVEDTGIGIDDMFLPFIFDEFKQASSGVNRSFEGTGLGLTVTKRLVELMDGTITVRTSNDEGSTFMVSLPLSTQNEYESNGHHPGERQALEASAARIDVS